jgi:hypothetical protein
MNTDMKWFAIVMIFIIGIPMAGLALEKYTVNQCRIAYASTNHTAEEIAKVCK